MKLQLQENPCKASLHYNDLGPLGDHYTGFWDSFTTGTFSWQESKLSVGLNYTISTESLVAFFFAHDWGALADIYICINVQCYRQDIDFQFLQYLLIKSISPCLL